MAIGIALAAEEHGKIVSARHFCNAVKSYLPTHGTFHKIAPCALCIFADAIRKECAEAKFIAREAGAEMVGRNSQGVRRGKVFPQIGLASAGTGCNPQGVRRGEAWQRAVRLPGFPGAQKFFGRDQNAAADVFCRNNTIS